MPSAVDVHGGSDVHTPGTTAASLATLASGNASSSPDVPGVLELHATNTNATPAMRFTRAS
jgi:hypothetical protein